VRAVRHVTTVAVVVAYSSKFLWEIFVETGIPWSDIRESGPVKQKVKLLVVVVVAVVGVLASEGQMSLG